MMTTGTDTAEAVFVLCLLAAAASLLFLFGIPGPGNLVTILREDRITAEARAYIWLVVLALVVGAVAVGTELVLRALT